jgi:hypothetical protein
LLCPRKNPAAPQPTAARADQARRTVGAVNNPPPPRGLIGRVELLAEVRERIAEGQGLAKVAC